MPDVRWRSQTEELLHLRALGDALADAWDANSRHQTECQDCEDEPCEGGAELYLKIGDAARAWRAAREA